MESLISRDAFRYYLRFYRSSRVWLAVTTLVSLAHSFLVLPLVLLVKYVFDTVLPARDFPLLMWSSAAMLALALATNGVYLWIRATILRITKAAIRDLRLDLLSRLYDLSRHFFTQTDRSALHARIVQDTERVDVMSNAVVAQVLPAGLACVALSGVLLWLNAGLFVVLLCVLPAMYLLNRTLGKRLRAGVARFRESFEGFSKGVLFVLQAMDLTRAHSAERLELERQRRVLDELRATSKTVAMLDTVNNLAQGSLSMVAGLVTLVVGGEAIARGRMTVGDLLSFYVTLRYLNSYAQMALSSIPQIVLGGESLGSLYELLRADYSQPYHGTRRVALTGSVALECVDFAYRPDRPVLRRVSLHLEPRCSLALVGPNGSGKSTIVSLLFGFYRPQGGRLLADGCPYDELDLAHLRRSFGWVPQDPFLFPASIADNIAYGTPEASARDIEEAAELATAHEFVRELDEGYRTPVGDNGLLLAGGQRQRIAIARALLRRPRLLILDEPTNHLDHDAVRRLMETLRLLSYQPAVLLISHDREIVRHSSVVYALDGGQASVVGTGGAAQP